MTDPTAVPVRDAATVILLRDGEDGVETLLLRRHLGATFVAGAHVFPGGGVDEADRDPAMARWCTGLDDGTASALLGVPEGGLAFWVAAIREAFEEAGALLAYDERGGMVDLAEPAVAARFDEHRRAVHQGSRSLAQVLEAEGLRLACDQLAYRDRWITPVGAPRRFDTRFFVARAPGGQALLHDRRETIESRWFRPGQALDAFAAGEIELILPTERSLQDLTAVATVDDALAASRHVDGAGSRA